MYLCVDGWCRFSNMDTLFLCVCILKVCRVFVNDTMLSVSVCGGGVGLI